MCTSKPFILSQNKKDKDIHFPQKDKDFFHRLKNNNLSFKDKNVVLILSRLDDPEADLVGALLASKGIFYIRVNAENVLNDTDVSINLNETGVSGTLNNMGETIDINKIKYVWIRHFYSDTYIYPSDLSIIDKKFICDSWDRLFKTLIFLGNAHFFNDYFAERMNTKPIQLIAARNVGFKIPNTLVSNDKKDIERFYQLDNVFAKAVHHHYVEYPSGTLHKAYGTTTQKAFVSTSYKIAPTTFQLKLDNIDEIRVFYINGIMFSGKYHDIQNDDWHLDDISDMNISAIDIPKKVKLMISRLMKQLNLNYGAVDLAVHNGLWYFFEVNPTGDWRWLEFKTKQNISSAVAEYIYKSMK